MSVDAAKVIEAAQGIFADVEQPDRIVATAHGDGLWTVNAVDEQGRPWPGMLVVVGKDLRVWPFSSNPGIHDPDTVFAALRGIYAAGVASAVDADLLAERIAVASSAIQAQRDSIVEDAEAGALRVLPERLLP